MSNNDIVSVADSDISQETFAQHYESISDVLKVLREQKVADIDALVPLVDKAMTSYRFCKGRIDAVRMMLESRLDADSEDSIDAPDSAE